MEKKFLVLMLTVVMAFGLAGCGAQSSSSQNSPSGNAVESNESTSDETGIGLEDGTYVAEFKTDSSMFHVNEAKDGKGTLTVKDGKGTIHVTLASVHIIKLFVGTAEDAQKDGAATIDPVKEKVTYSDGYTEKAYAFDVPVPAIGVEYDVAILGTKGTWYSHKVSVENPTLEQ